MTARLSELIDAMDDYAHLLAIPTVEWDGESCRTTLTLTVVPTEPNQSLQTRGLYDELRYVADLAQMRALCARFDIKPEKLERLLPQKEK